MRIASHALGIAVLVAMAGCATSKANEDAGIDTMTDSLTDTATEVADVPIDGVDTLVEDTSEDTVGEDPESYKQPPVFASTSPSWRFSRIAWDKSGTNLRSVVTEVLNHGTKPSRLCCLRGPHCLDPRFWGRIQTTG